MWDQTKAYCSSHSSSKSRGPLSKVAVKGKCVPQWPRSSLPSSSTCKAAGPTSQLCRLQLSGVSLCNSRQHSHRHISQPTCSQSGVDTLQSSAIHATPTAPRQCRLLVESTVQLDIHTLLVLWLRLLLWTATTPCCEACYIIACTLAYSHCAMYTWSAQVTDSSICFT